MRDVFLLSWFLVIAIFISPISLALAQRTSCPGLDTSANVEQQARCWFEADSRGDAQCETKPGSVSACILQSVAWCADAALDDPALANTCFLSNIRAGQFEEALAIADYLQTPTEEVRQCRKALSAITIRIISEPEGARIEVKGEQVGAAPIETTLGKGWWKNRVKAKFGSGKEAVEVVAAGNRLMKVFDRRKCTMGALVLQSPSTEPQTLILKTQETETVGATDINTTPKELEEEGVSVPGIALTTVGGVALITGAILVAMAESNSASISSKTDGEGENWTSVEGDYESITPFRVGGWVSIGAGAVLATVGVLLLTNAFGKTSKENASSIVAALANGKVSLRW